MDLWQADAGKAAARNRFSQTGLNGRSVFADMAEPNRKQIPREDGVPLFELRGLGKNFAGVQALKDGNLKLYSGEIHALVGGNGAGKSTIVNILSGNFSPEVGEIFHNGSPITIDSAKKAREIGIATIYQNLSLVDTLDVTSNLFLGQERMCAGPLGALGFLNRRAMEREAAREFKRLGINIPNVRSKVARMSGGQRQAIACARVLCSANPKLLIMDEPTAALGVRETREIYDLMFRCRDEGAAILLISHNMEDVLKVSDRITVLRLGETIAQLDREDADNTLLVGLITGAIEHL